MPPRQQPHIADVSAGPYRSTVCCIGTHLACTEFSPVSAPIDLRGLPAGTFPVKITVITTTGSIISGTRTYKTCHRKVGFHGNGRL